MLLTDKNRPEWFGEFKNDQQVGSKSWRKSICPGHSRKSGAWREGFCEDNSTHLRNRDSFTICNLANFSNQIAHHDDEGASEQTCMRSHAGACSFSSSQFIHLRSLITARRGPAQVSACDTHSSRNLYSCDVIRHEALSNAKLTTTWIEILIFQNVVRSTSITKWRTRH